MAKRKSLTKKLRFEVFKRDSFTCQYCGRKAPDVLLVVDHINPVAAGGVDDILNLITSCFDCNAGKSDRKLSENTVLEKQRDQLQQLQERKEQIEMMFEWQKGLLELDDEVTTRLAEYWGECLGGYYYLNDNGKKELKKLRRKFEPNELMQAMKIATDSYLEYEEGGKPTHQSVGEAWRKVGGICTTKRRDAADPGSSRLYYIRGILRNRLAYCNDLTALRHLRDALAAGADVDSLEHHAKAVRNWTQWFDDLQEFIDEGTPFD